MIDPKNPETVYVASPGHLFGPNPERGVFKTTDGGKTWNKVKFIDEDTGLHRHRDRSRRTPTSSTRRATSGAAAAAASTAAARAARSGRRTDAGKTWTKLTGNGLPPGTYGRIALDVSRSNPNVVYAQIEAGDVGQPVTTRAGDRPGAATEATPPGAAAVHAAGGHAAGRRGRRGEPARRPPAAAAPAQRRRRREAAVAADAATSYDWCNNAGPEQGLRRRGRGGQPAAPPNQTPPAARHRRAAACSAPRTRAQAGRS